AGRRVRARMSADARLAHVRSPQAAGSGRGISEDGQARGHAGRRATLTTPRIAPADAAARLEQQLGIAPTLAGTLLTVEVPLDRWQAVGRAARDLGYLHFNWLSATDWKDQGCEVVCRVENLEAQLASMLPT